MPIAALKNASLHYVFQGPSDAPVIVLSNSLGTEFSMWDGQMAGLAQKFRVLRYDTRGHGGSRAEGDAYSLNDLGGDVLELLDLLAIVRFHVCGISLGGMTALWLAIHAPDRVLSAMPCNTAARIGSDSSWNTRIEQVATHGLASIVSATMERWFTPSFRENEPARVEATKQMFLRTDAQGYLACCAALRDADLSRTRGHTTR
jgi:3-oxoadipate enol-lactonase